MTSEQQALRRRLRARGRQLGDRLEDEWQARRRASRRPSAPTSIGIGCCSRRFLAECGLLIEPASGVPVSVDECKELARERGVDWISLASTFAQRMLPQIFRADDAVLEIALPAEHRQPLEQLYVASIRSVSGGRQPRLGLPVLAVGGERRVNESENEDWRRRAPRGDATLHRGLHGGVPASQHARCVVGRTTSPNGVERRRRKRRAYGMLAWDVEWKYLRFVQDRARQVDPSRRDFRGWPTAAREIAFSILAWAPGISSCLRLPILVAMRRLEEGSLGRGSSVRRGASRQPVRSRNRPTLHPDRCIQLGARRLEGWRLAAAAAAEPRLLRPRSERKREDWVST